MTEDQSPPRTIPFNIAMEALSRAPFAMVLTNPGLKDNPIVYVNSAFEKVTGYSADAAIGRNCRFLQGEGTDPKAVDRLRRALAEEAETAVDLLNYRADGKPFWNRLMIAPVRVDDGHAPYFLGVQMRLDFDPTDDARISAGDADLDTTLQEIQHRVKNHLSMIVGMIRLQARQSDARADFGTLARRIELLQLLYEELGKTSVAGSNEAPISLGAYLTRVASAIAHLDGRRGVRVNVNAEAITVRFETATRLGLLVSEILTNALQHAFEGRDSGLVEVSLRELSGDVIRIQISDDGIGLPDDVDWPNDGALGSHIVRELALGLDSKVVVTRAASGLIVTVDVPASQRD